MGGWERQRQSQRQRKRQRQRQPDGQTDSGFFLTPTNSSPRTRALAPSLLQALKPKRLLRISAAPPSAASSPFRRGFRPRRGFARHRLALTGSVSPGPTRRSARAGSARSISRARPPVAGPFRPPRRAYFARPCISRANIPPDAVPPAQSCISRANIPPDAVPPAQSRVTDSDTREGTRRLQSLQ